MSPAKRALLIASSSFGLQGPENDVRLMSQVLVEQGFKITSCSNQDATRQGILDACRKIIGECEPEDTLVIYYSGHGGIVERHSPTPQQSNEAGAGVSHTSQPWRHQFLVPTDFRCGDGVENEFTGILKAEVKQLRAEASRRTRNVTIILDCCHSGGMSRHPTREAVARSLSQVQYATLSRHFDLLRANSTKPEAEVEERGGAVTIVAAAANEKAWEYPYAPGQWIGSMTQAFANALTAVWKSCNDGGELISWRTMMARVSELVNIQFPQQHPHVEGPETRLVFSLQESLLNALVLRVEQDNRSHILQAGRLSGVRVGNEYGLWPLEAEERSQDTRLGTAIVTHITGSKALTKPNLLPGRNLGSKGALAVLEKESLLKWPIAYPEHLTLLGDLIDKSNYICNAMDQDSPLAKVFHEESRLLLKDSQGQELVSYDVSADNRDSLATASRDLISRAEVLAKAQHIRTLTCDNPKEKLDHNLQVTIGTVENGEKERVIAQDGNGYISESDLIYVSLENQGSTQLYVTVFNINVWGKISLVSCNSPRGIDLPPNQSSVLGEGDFGALDGLPITWPNGFPKMRPVNECLVIILTDSPLDLRCLVDAHHVDGRGSGSGQSTLEQFSFSLATGSLRDIGSTSRSLPLRWNLLQINLALRPFAWQGDEDREVQPEDIPEPSDLAVEEMPLYPPFEQARRDKSLSGILNAIKRIPPYVWVVNKHDEEILVVVSKHRPNRLLTQVGFDVSATGAGVSFSSTMYHGPVCKKTLAPWKENDPNCGNMGVFPLWTRNQGFGVVSIFKGPERELYIENDQIPIGATAYFSNTPNLSMVDHAGKAIEVPSGPRAQR